MLRAIFCLVRNIRQFTWYTMRKLIRKLTSPLRRKQRRFVALKLPSGLELAAPARKFGPLTLPGRGHGAWWAFDDALETIADDTEIEGVFFRAEQTKMGLAEASELSARIDRLRESGKRVYCHMNQASLLDYLLATSADTIMMTPPGRIYAFGLRMDMMFLGDAFERFGIKAQFINLGRFKAASHRFTRRHMSAAQQMMMAQLLKGIAQSSLERVAKRRNIAPEDARALFDEGPISARTARRINLIDQSRYSDTIKEAIKDETVCDRRVVVESQTRYLARALKPFVWQPLRKRRASVAVLHLSGVIMMGNEGAGGRLRQTITPRPVIKALNAIQRNTNIKAVVLHIDSPGGSALASDLIWRQIRKLAETRPVIAALGNVAASGGYYLAVGAHKIVATPETITGSIGVIAGKLSGGELLEKIGVRFDQVSVGKTSNFTSLTSPMNDTEVGNLQRDIRAFYRRFLHRVSTGRALDRRKLHRLARGRVFTGQRALKLGLVDELGGLQQAIEIACNEAGLSRDKAVVQFVDHRKAGVNTLLKSRTDPDPFEVSHAPPSLKLDLLDELLPVDLHPLLATALLLREGTALTLWPFLSQPSPA